ncbi:hypothetical protein WICMUC_005697 [Wickerhamomyces mucosus]|uniref:HECT-type E3 ubiquitin transferase n=1 Tax=Wickerhamomyces mucosus TaxID=1378264 RepID=A0A9P8P7K4_9ASCO|nr:hypothetical protein WICMUC_005697 [Wickerhamomyces mucosus]
MIITKKEEKYTEEIAVPLKELINKIIESTDSDLPHVLKANLKWDTSKSSLMSWISVLNKFDSILESITKKYDLQGLYSKPVLLNDDDRKLTIAIVDFIALLLENSTNKSLFSSAHRLNDLLKSPTNDLIISILKVFVILGKKFSIKSMKRTFVATRKVSDRLYPFALILPASTLTANTGTNDNFGLIDFIKDEPYTPKKWKHLELIYYPTAEESNLDHYNLDAFHDQNLLETPRGDSSPSAKKSKNSNVTPSPKKRKSHSAETTKVETLNKLSALFISEEDIKRLSLQEIIEIGINRLPPKYWFRLGLRAMMAKAFSDETPESLKLRKDLVVMKLLSIGLLISVNNEFEVSSRVFEADPTLLATLSDLVDLHKEIPVDVRLAAAQALDCISALKTWSSDIVKHFGGSVSHGLLYQNLRQITKAIRDSSPTVDETFNLTFFNIITNLVETKSLSIVLVSAGIIQQFSELLTLQTDFKKSTAAAIQFLDSVVCSNPDNILLFREANGFTKLIEAIRYEVDFALENPGYGGGAPKLSITYFSISFKQANLIRVLLKFVQHLIQKESGDRVRNLFDSPLLKYINKILINVPTFGYTLVTAAINIFCEIIHNEPTAYPILKESGTIDILVNNFESFFGKSAELLTSLPNIIGAISLNNEGLESIKSVNLIKKFFKIFRNNSFAKALVQDDGSDVLAGSIDELARHYPAYKPLITEEVISLINEIPEFAAKNLPTPEIYTSNKTRSFYHSDDEEVIDDEEGAKSIDSCESIDEVYILENASVFLGNLIQLSNAWVSLMDVISFEKWLPLITLVNSPFDYPYSNCMYPINGALKYFDDEKRDYAPRILVNEISKQVSELEDYYTSNEKSSLFQKYDGQKDASNFLLNRLISVNNILFAFVDIYCNPSALSVTRVDQLAKLFSDEKGVSLLRKLGKLLERVSYEEHLIRTSAPAIVAEETNLTQYDEGFPPLKINFNEKKEEPRQDKTSARFKNTLQIRFLNQRIHSSIAVIFNTLLMLPTTARQDFTLDSYRGFTVLISDEITKIFVSFLDSSVCADPPFYLLLLYTIHYCLSEPTSDKVLTLGAIMFMQNGGFLREKKLLTTFWNQIKDLDRGKIDDLKKVNYVIDTKEGITYGIVIHILVLLNKISSYESLMTINHSPQFYEGNLSGSLSINANNLCSSFVVQSRILCFGVLSSILNEEGMGSIDEDVYLPDVVVFELVKLAKNIYSLSGERNLNQSDGTLFQINWKSAKNPRSRIEYLISLGFEEKDANFIVSQANGDLTILQHDDRPSDFEDVEKWDRLCQDAKNSPYLPPNQEIVDSQYQNYHTLSELEDLRQMKADFILDQYLLIAQHYEKSVNAIGEFLISSFLVNPKYNISSFEVNILHTILDFIYSFEIPDRDSKELSSMLHLFGLLVKNESVFFGCHSSLESYASQIIESLKPEYANHDWFAKSLYGLQRIVAGSDLMDIGKPTVGALIPLPKSIPVSFQLNQALKDKLFDVLLSIDEITSYWTALDVTRLLFSYAKVPEYSRRIVSSGIINKIVKRMTPTKTDRPDRDFSLQASFIVLLRRCYETKDVLQNIVIREINKQFSSKSKKDNAKDRVRELQSVLRDSSGVVLRAPELFIQEISKRARFAEFSEPLRNLSCRLVDVAEDVEMVDSDHFDRNEKSVNSGNTPSLADNQTGIVHLLLTELMSAVKNDWLSDPPLTDDEKKEKDKEDAKHEIPKISRVDVHKNSNCSYIIYLLKILVELLSSYKQSKLEFLTFSKKILFQSSKLDQPKPRSTALNFFLHQLIIGPSRELNESEKPRRKAVYELASKVVIAFISTIDSAELKVDPKNVDPDMIFIRKFTVDTMHRVIKEVNASPPNIKARYDKLVSLCTVLQSLLKTSRDRLVDPSTVEFDDYHMAKTIIESSLTNTLSSVLADIDLNYADYFFVLESITGILNGLGLIKTTHQELFRDSQPVNGADEEEVEEDENDYKEETPDLFRNSTLGMYDVAEIDDEEDFEDNDELSSSDDEIGSSNSIEIVYSDDEGGSIINSDEGELIADDEDDDEDNEMEEDSDDFGEEEEEVGVEGDTELDDDDDDDGIDDEIESIQEVESGDYDLNSNASSGDDESVSGDGGYLEDEGSDDFYDGEIQSEDEYPSSIDSQLENIFDSISDDEEITNDARVDHRNHRMLNSNLTGDNNDVQIVEIESEDEEDYESVVNDSEEETALQQILDTFRRGARPGVRGRHHNRGNAGRIQDPRRLLANLESSLNINSGLNPLARRRGIDARSIPAFESFSNVTGFRRIMENRQNPPELTLKSTRERYNEVASSLYNKSIDSLRPLVTIVNNIYLPSREIYEAKRKEDEERQQQEEEILRKKRLEEEEEVEKRQQEQLQNTANSPEDVTNCTEDIPVRDPIYVTVGDREVDISGTDIDPEFFEALPDDMREEVLTQHIRERRAEATEAGSSNRELDPEFLNALPDNIREDILQQEAITRRLSSARSSIQSQAQTHIDNEDSQNTSSEPAKDTKGKHKVFFTPLVDKYGVASLIRFVFIPQSFHGRRSLYQLLGQLSINKQTRTEVLGMLLFILKEGIHDQTSLERAFNQISAKARAPINSSTLQTTKFGTPRTPSTPAQVNLRTHGENFNHFPSRATPFIVASQVLEALQFLLESDPQLRYYFLTENEGYQIKKLGSAKKLNSYKQTKYPLNSLLDLLGYSVKEKSGLMDLLSRIIQITTRPLNALKRAQEETESAGAKKKIELPNVLDSSLRNIVTILISDDCSSRTFQQTLSAMQNLLVIKSGRSVFSSELSKYASTLGVSLVQDLKELIAVLEASQDVTDFEADVMAKFTSSSSDQSKLLKVLTALDYLFTSDERTKKEELENNDVLPIHQNRELTKIYYESDLGTLWGALSDTLNLFESNRYITHVASTLLPLIEALMVVCKHSKVKELEAKDVLKYENKKCDFANEPIESLFFSFTDTHKKILNQMVRSNSKLMSGPFGMLVRNPRVLEFDNKKNYFDRKLHSEELEKTTLNISVRRDQVFLDSFRSLFFKSKEEFRNSKLEISFKGEAGVDAGGVTREWYQVLSRQMFNPDYALFLPVASDKTTFHPNRTSGVNPEHLSFFKFIGRVIGKAIFDNCFLDCHFSRDVYKSILGRSVSLKDLETIDLDYYKSLMWMLENDITDIIIETFSVDTDDYGEVKTIDLVPDGREISVTEENKHDYVRLVVEYRLQKSVKEQVDNFLQGFHEIIPKDLISIFDEQELELLISGLPDIDVDDWKNNTVYVNYTPSSQEISYFWRAVRSFDKEERAKLLQFATGTSKVPLNGFKELEGSNGSTKFSIHKDFGSTERLPSSHTCFNQIDLPAYDSYETLRGSLLLAITEGHEGFGLA